MFQCLKYFFLMTTPSVAEEVEHLELSYTTSEQVKWYNCFGKQIGSFLKVKHTFIIYEPAVLLLSLYPKFIKAYTQRLE